MASSLLSKFGITERDLIEACIEARFFIDLGVVTAVSSDKTTVDVQHVVRPKVNGEDLPITTTSGVEVYHPGGSAEYSEYWELEAGDIVLLVGLRDFISDSSVGISPDTQKVGLHYVQETMKAIPMGRYNSGARAHLHVKDGKWKLEASSEITLNGDTKRFVTWDELNTALQNHTHSAGTLVSPSGAVTGATGAPIALDISAAKTTTIKTGG